MREMKVKEEEKNPRITFKRVEDDREIKNHKISA